MTDPHSPKRPTSNNSGASGSGSEGFGPTTQNSGGALPHSRFFDKYLPATWAARRLRKRRRVAAMSRRKRIGRRISIATTWFLSGLVLLMVITAVAFYEFSRVPSPDELKSDQSVTILYADGSVMATFSPGGENRTIVPLTQVPDSVRWAVLAAEDRKFYSEPGISISGTARAVLNDITGGDTQGGSGITQQYVKNAYLNSQRTLTRKLKEIAIATKLARDYSKDQILEYYLNTVYFGRGAYGVQAAAEAYFGVSIDKVTTAQGALLAALLRAPYYYDPANNPTESKARWDYVIEGMVETGHLSTTDAAATVFPSTQPVKDLSFGVTGPRQLIVNQVEDELAVDGITKDQLQYGGLTIKTTIDPVAQTDAEAAIAKTFGSLTAAQQNLKQALIAENPTSGAVLAYFGNSDGTGYDYASQGTRPPGSTFKPFVLATALKQTLAGTGTLTINSKVDGSFTKVIQGTTISNDPSDKAVSGPSVTVADAMKYSLNTTFDQMAVDVGPAKVADTAHDAGIARTVNNTNTLQEADGSTTFGIGIGDYPVRPIDMATAFSTFENGGQANPAYFVTQVTSSDGTTLFTHTAKTAQAFDAKVANDVTVTLGPIASSSGFALASGRASAAKTGTEGIQDSKTGANSDAWTVGFTPQVSVAVWVGSGNSTTPIVDSSGNPEYGKDLPGKTWKLFLDTYLKGKPNMPLPTKAEVGVAAATPSPSVTAPTSSTPTGTRTSSAPTPSPSISRTPSPTRTPVPTATPVVVTPSPVPAPTSAAAAGASAGGVAGGAVGQVGPGRSSASAP